MQMTDVRRREDDRTGGQHVDEVGRRAHHHLPTPAGESVLAFEAEDRMHVVRVGADELGDRQGGIRRCNNGLLAGVAILPEATTVHDDPTGPVLRVDDENAAWADDHMVHVRESSTGPPDVVQCCPSRWERGQDLRRGGLTLSALLEQLGRPIETLRLLPRPTRDFTR